MVKSEDEYVNEKVTLCDFKQNVNVFSIRKLRKLVFVIIDAISDVTTEKDLFNNRLDIFQDEKIAMVTQISDIEKKMAVLEAEKYITKGKDKKDNYFSRSLKLSSTLLN